MIKIYEFFSDYYSKEKHYQKKTKFFPNEYVIMGIQDIFDSSHKWNSIYMWYTVEKGEWVYQLCDAENGEQVKDKIVNNNMKHTFKEVEFMNDLHSDFLPKALIKLCFLANTRKGENLFRSIFKDSRPYVLNRGY